MHNGIAMTMSSIMTGVGMTLGSMGTTVDLADHRAASPEALVARAQNVLPLLIGDATQAEKERHRWN